MNSKYIQVLNNSKEIAPATAQAPKSLQDCARLLQIVGQDMAVLKLKDLQNFWLSVMADKSASHKDRLAASKLYAQSIGAFDSTKQSKGINGARLQWRTIPLEPVQNTLDD